MKYLGQKEGTHILVIVAKLLRLCIFLNKLQKAASIQILLKSSRHKYIVYFLLLDFCFLSLTFKTIGKTMQQPFAEFTRLGEREYISDSTEYIM